MGEEERALILKLPEKEFLARWDAMNEEQHQALGNAGIKRILDITNKNGAARPEAMPSAPPRQAARPRPREHHAPDLSVSVEAEQSLLGALLLDNEALARIAKIIGWSHFHGQEHQTIYRHIAALVNDGKAADIVTTAESLESAGKLAFVGGAAYLALLAQGVPSALHIRRYAELVRERAQRRELVTLGSELQEKAVRPGADLAELRRDALARIERQRPSPDTVVPTPLDWAGLTGREPPQREWAIRYWLGMGYPTLLVGPPGAGKTLLCQQLAAALSIGRNFLADTPAPRRVLMWASEDDHDELWRRQQAIARWLGVASLTEFSGFMLVPRFGMENTLYAPIMGTPGWTPLLAKLVEQANDHRADVVILDNLAQVYGANENVRHETTSFVNGLHGALGLHRALALIGHPSRQQGSEMSGSSAWEASVRMRLYFASRLPDQKPDDAPPEDDANETDSIRYLAKRKANYTERDFRRFTFRDGVLSQDPVEETGGMVAVIRRDKASRVVIEAARRFAEMGVRVASTAQSGAFLPKLILQYKLAEGCTKAELSAATRAAMVSKQLALGTVWNDKRNKVQSLRVTDTIEQTSNAKNN